MKHSDNIGNLKINKELNKFSEAREVPKLKEVNEILKRVKKPE